MPAGNAIGCARNNAITVSGNSEYRHRDVRSVWRNSRHSRATMLSVVSDISCYRAKPPNKPWATWYARVEINWTFECDTKRSDGGKISEKKIQNLLRGNYSCTVSLFRNFAWRYCILHMNITYWILLLNVENAQQTLKLFAAKL